MIEEVTPEEIEAARQRQRLVNAYHRAFASDDGKAVLSDLRAIFGVDAPVFIRGASGFDPVHAAVRDGQRQVILHIASILAEEAQGDSDVSKPTVEVKSS